ncbi:MAG TPA: hypothetical protein VEU33_22255 [Archangium sp.]|nr:hypothetical protein [Archangium sp.]
MLLTAGLTAQFACGGPASNATDSQEQPKGVALTGPNAIQPLDMPSLAQGVDVTALVASGYHSAS